jgi:tyrosyl-tRNA synthetase
LRKIQQFAEAGHHVTFLIGDFTALIGDTSDKDKERPVLTYEQIQENFKTYKKQAEKIVDFSKVKVVFNSEWLKVLKFADIVKLCQHFSVGDFVSRELIKNRLTQGSRVGLHEFLYPVMQGYDSFHLDTDIQIGGADQTFNMQAGRTLLKDLSDKESFVLVTGYLEGTDGRKMSKTWVNAIWVSDEPNEMYGKVMSIRDELIINYFVLVTNISLTEIEKIKKSLKNGDNPMEIKKKLAHAIVTELHSREKADSAEDVFDKTFRKQSPEYSETLTFDHTPTLVEAVSQLSGSMSEAKRLINQGGVDLNGKTAKEPKHKLSNNDKLKVGKKTFVTVSIK